MIPLIAPPEIFSAYSIAEDGSSLDLAKGTHLRVFAGMGASFPLTPFVVFRMKSDASQPRSTHWSASHDPHILTLVPGSDNPTVRIDIDDSGSIDYATLVDQKNRLIMARNQPPWMFSAPVLQRLQIRGEAADLSVRTRSIYLGPLLENPDPADILSLPVENIHPWYLGVQNRDMGLERVKQGAPLRLNPLDRPDGLFDPVDPAAELARIEAMLASWQIGGNLENLLMTMIDDPSSAPWSQIETTEMTGPDGRKQWAKTSRLGALQMASLDPGLARFLGFAKRLEDLPDLDGAGEWDTLAVVGLFAFDPKAFERRGLDLVEPHPESGHLLKTLMYGLEQTVGQDLRGEIEAIIDQVRNNELIAAPFVALTAPVPSPLTFAPPTPQIMQVQWQAAGDNNPASLYRASFAFPDMPPFSIAALAAQIDGVWTPRHDKVELTPGFNPASRSIPRVIGHERETTSRLRRYGGTSLSPAGLLSDENIPAGSVTYRAWAADFFGRFGEPVEFQVQPPDRPKPPPPILRFYIQRHEHIDADSVEPLSPGVLKLTIAVPRPLTELPYNDDEKVRAGSAIVVPRLDDLAAGSLPITRLKLSLDGRELDTIDVSVAGFFEKEFPLPVLKPQEQKTWSLRGSFTDTAGTASEAAILPVQATDPRPPGTYPTGIGLFWTSAPGPSNEVELSLTWQAEPRSRHRVYLTDQAGLNLTAAEIGEALPNMPASRGRIAAAGCQKVIDHAPDIEPRNFRLLTEPPVEAGDDGRVVLNVNLPRSLATVQFLRIVPLGPDGVEPPFENCGIVPVAVPESHRPAAPWLEREIDHVSGSAKLHIVTDAFDLMTLQRDEPGLFNPAGGNVEAPRYRIRRAIDTVADPMYAPIIAQGTLEWEDTRFAAEFIDDNGGRQLAPFVNYVYWAEVRLPPERRVPVGVIPSNPPGGISVVDPANARDYPRPLSLPSAARAVMIIPPAVPAVPATEAVTIWRKPVNAEGMVEIWIKIADLPQLHARAVGPYRLAYWTQWSERAITTLPPESTLPAITTGKFLAIMVPVDESVDPVSPLKLRLAIVDPLGRMGEVTTLDVLEGDVMPAPVLSEPENILMDPNRHEGNYTTWEGLIAFQWQVLSQVYMELADQYQVRFAFVDPDPMGDLEEPYFELVMPLSDIETVEAPISLEQINARGLARGIVRVVNGDTISFIGWTRNARVNAEFAFALEDPGRQSTERTQILE